MADGERRSSRLAEKELRQGADVLMGLHSAPPVFDSHMSSVDVYDPLTKLAKSVYGEDVINRWISDGRKVRDIWEKAPPKAQCDAAIGPSDGQNCWLCGSILLPTSYALVPICEHILPIAQAVFFLELFSSATQLQDGHVPGIMKLEYGWSHNICNAVKNDSIFIEQDPRYEGSVRINNFAIGSFLYKLANTQSTLPGVGQVTDILADERYFKYRLSEIQKRVQKVVDFINKPTKQESNLLVLARSASFMDPTNVNKTFADMVNLPKTGGKTVKRTSELKRTRRHNRK